MVFISCVRMHGLLKCTSLCSSGFFLYSLTVFAFIHSQRVSLCSQWLPLCIQSLSLQFQFVLFKFMFFRLHSRGFHLHLFLIQLLSFCSVSPLFRCHVFKKVLSVAFMLCHLLYSRAVSSTFVVCICFHVVCCCFS